MTFQLFKGWVVTITTGLVIIAAIVLLALQWGNTTTITLYGPATDVNTLLLMLLSAVGGILMVWLVKALLYGIGIIRLTPSQKDTSDVSTGQ